MNKALQSRKSLYFFVNDLHFTVEYFFVLCYNYCSKSYRGIRYENQDNGVEERKVFLRH